MSAFILGGTPVQWPLDRYSDAVDRRWIIAAVCAAASVTGLALALVGRGGAVPSLLFPFLFGAATLPLYVLSVAHSNDRMQASDFVEASASLLLMNGVASVAGPLLAAFVMAHAGMSALFFYTAGVELLMALFTVWRTAPVSRASRRSSGSRSCRCHSRLHRRRSISIRARLKRPIRRRLEPLSPR
jgi:MFS family permease